MAVFKVSENIIIQEFFNFMSSVGITPKYNFEPILDGRTHRFATDEDRGNSKSGAYYIHADGFINFGAMDFHRHSEMQKGSISRDYFPEYDKTQDSRNDKRINGEPARRSAQWQTQSSPSPT